ncbi:receptor-type tyrosine-protein phosphatase alpha-like [Sycon ciliatum]|uniref:receptor-type tyrosine-protein phosphatase alpha-like n=1 Tax=Sycon ciliatum TaxID=27933 RepID=UPI0031F64407
MKKQRRKGRMEVTKKDLTKKDMGLVIMNPVLGDGASAANGQNDELTTMETTSTFKKALRNRTKSSSSLKPKVEPMSNRGPISVEKFPKHAQDMYASEGFAAEYDIIQQLAPKMMAAEVCSRPENKLKNRYANIIAYDDTRVALSQTGGDPNSDYINANWLSGFKCEKEFIATQGPVPQSIIDFWRMIWETKARTIAMVTNLEEGDKLKCNQYWPTQGGIIYGNLVVTLTGTLSQSHHVIRTFQVATEDDVNKGVTENIREVKQFHFISWPDHGVPAHPTPLLTYWQRIRKSQPRAKANDQTPQPPVIVHCSAGVGRTGTLIVIDAMIAQAEREKKLDVFSFVMELRRQRNFMVQTESQYKFIHDALVEYFSFGASTEVPVNDLRQCIRSLNMMSEGESGYEIEYKRLACGVPNRSPVDLATKAYNKKKNRFTSFVPYNQPAGHNTKDAPNVGESSGRVILPAQASVEGSDYINASFVDSFSMPKAYIATQGPMLNTITDFWTMVWKYDCQSIVMLSNLREKNSEHSVLYWPDKESEPSSYGDILVTFAAEKILTDFAVRDFTVTHTKESVSRTVRQFHYIGWPERGVPQSGKAMLEMIGQVEHHQLSSGNKTVVVHCSNGSGRTGTYIGISSAIDRAKSENSVDVFQMTKMMRMQRAGCVQSSEQYKFIYNTVLDYIASFETYGNFK